MLKIGVWPNNVLFHISFETLPIKFVLGTFTSFNVPTRSGSGFDRQRSIGNGVWSRNNCRLISHFLTENCTLFLKITFTLSFTSPEKYDIFLLTYLVSQIKNLGTVKSWYDQLIILLIFDLSTNLWSNIKNQNQSLLG